MIAGDRPWAAADLRPQAMMTHENPAYAGLAEKAFQEAFAGFRLVARKSSPVQLDYCIADRIVRVCFADAAQARRMTVALQERRVTGAHSPELVIYAWQQVARLTTVEELVRFQVRLSWNTSVVDRAEHGVRIRNGSPTTLVAYRQRTEQALWWTIDAQSIPVWEQAAPFQQIFNWWLAGQTRCMVHAGAVGDDHGAVLLAGKGGSGKSTTALAVLQHGLCYRADDYCIVGLDPVPTVYNLYGTGKLKEHGIALLPRYQDTAIAEFSADHQKRSTVLASAVGNATILANRPLKAMILPSVRRQTATRLMPVSLGRALMALAPSSVLQLPGAEGAKFRAFAAMVSRLPCFVMEVGQDLEQAADALRALLAQS